MCMGWRLKLMLQLFFYLQIQPLVVWPALFPEQTPGQTAGLTFNPFGTDRVILKWQLIWGSPWDDNMHYSCVLYVSQGEYLGVSVEHFDSLGGDEEIHLCHGLRLTLGGLFTHTHTHTHTDTHTHTTRQSTIRHTLMKLPRAQIQTVGLCCNPLSPKRKENVNTMLHGAWCLLYGSEEP